ncbi:MAG: flagellar hook-length control protein FliK [Actinomycetes bacterium]
MSASPAAPLAPYASAVPAAVTQLVSALAPLRQQGDGVHRITVQLHPAELGAVQIRVELHGDVLRVHLAGASEATRDVLRAALPDLRQELSSGTREASVDVSTELSQQNPWQGPGPQGQGGLTEGRGHGWGRQHETPDRPGRGANHQDSDHARPLSVSTTTTSGTTAIDVRV